MSLKVLRKGVASLADLRDAGLTGMAPMAGRRVWHVNQSGDGDYITVQAAVDAASEGDVVLIDPAEYDEDVVVAKRFLTLMGNGPFGTVRITGTSAGTKTALTIDGSDFDGDGYDCGVYNLNLEGRTSSGTALLIQGLIRRVHVAGCKIHGGDQAVKIVGDGASGQVVDVRIEDCLIANSAIGISLPASTSQTNQVYILNNIFAKITADCILSEGGNIDIHIIGNVFGNNADDEPTQYLDLDTAGTSGIVAGNFFARATHLNTSIALDADVIYVGNYTEEGVNTARPDGT